MEMSSFLQGPQPSTTDTDTIDTSANETENTIYYLRTSTPHTHDISLKGPFPTIKYVAGEIYEAFRDECFRGRTRALELFRDGQLGSIEHIVSPIGNDQNKTRTCRIIKETNTAVCAHRARVYNVMSFDVYTDIAETMSHIGPDDPPMKLPLKDYRVHGTFIEESAAVARAREVAQAVQMRMHGSVVKEHSEEEMQNIGGPGEVLAITVVQAIWAR